MVSFAHLYSNSTQPLASLFSILSFLEPFKLYFKNRADSKTSGIGSSQLQKNNPVTDA